MTIVVPETVGAILDLIALLCVLAGAVLCIAASVGLLRFPDLLSRMHASTKPQVLGVLLVVLAVALTTRTVPVLTMAALVAVFQLLTAPVASQMLSRAAVRTAQVELGKVAGDPVNPTAPRRRRRSRETTEDGEPGRNRPGGGSTRSPGKTPGDRGRNPGPPH